MSQLRLEYIDPATLDGHPSNWKVHTAEQLDAVDAFKKRVGFAGALLFNERTGRLLDGHGRKERWKGEPVPVLIGSWSEEEEREVLAYLDPLGWMAQTSKLHLDKLTADTPNLLNPESAHLKAVLDALKASAEQFANTMKADGDKPEATASGGEGGGDDKKSPPSQTAAEVPDALWPTDNPWGVPSLLPELQADAVDFPVMTWGSLSHSKAMRGTYHFYEHDAKFKPLWDSPSKVLLSGCPTVVEPNFSTHEQTPFTCALWAIYRKRWLARYWQSKGVRVLVDLNVCHDLLRPHQATAGAVPNLLGVPRGWKAYASRSHANRPKMLVQEWRLAREHSGVDHPLFLVIGGGQAVKKLADMHGWTWVPEQLEAARGRRGTA